MLRIIFLCYALNQVLENSQGKKGLSFDVVSPGRDGKARKARSGRRNGGLYVPRRDGIPAWDAPFFAKFREKSNPHGRNPFAVPYAALTWGAVQCMLEGRGASLLFY